MQRYLFYLTNVFAFMKIVLEQRYLEMIASLFDLHLALYFSNNNKIFHLIFQQRKNWQSQWTRRVQYQWLEWEYWPYKTYFCGVGHLGYRITLHCVPITTSFESYHWIYRTSGQPSSILGFFRFRTRPSGNWFHQQRKQFFAI